MHPRRSPGRSLALAAATGAALVVGLLAPGTSADADVGAGTLPLGDADLVETRSTTRLAPGVSLTRIVRGTEPADPDEIDATTRGPWVVNVLAIDPDRARGRLEATYGPDIARVERTTELVRDSGALAGVNASFFTFTADPAYPGDPVGAAISAGVPISEPTGDPAEVALVFDSRRGTFAIGALDWSGALTSRRSGAELALEYLNHPPVVPADCAALADQTICPVSGDVVSFTSDFASSTPSGAGVEVVLDRRGCVVRTDLARGTVLRRTQTSVQATGAESGALLALARGCLVRDVVLTDDEGREVTQRRGVFGVNGRYQLTEDGSIVVPDGTGSFFGRNPRTIAGTTSDGTILLVTIDGRQSTSVGTTMDETAAVADALGMVDAVNLDGGGSTTMSVRGELVNSPSSTSGERAVGDAIVYVSR